MPKMKPVRPTPKFGFVDNAERLNSRAAMVRGWQHPGSGSAACELMDAIGLERAFFACLFAVAVRRFLFGKSWRSRQMDSPCQSIGPVALVAFSHRQGTPVHKLQPTCALPQLTCLIPPLRLQIGFFGILIVEAITNKALLSQIGFTVGQGLPFEF